MGMTVARGVVAGMTANTAAVDRAFRLTELAVSARPRGESRISHTQLALPAAPTASRRFRHAEFAIPAAPTASRRFATPSWRFRDAGTAYTPWRDARGRIRHRHQPGCRATRRRVSPRRS